MSVKLLKTVTFLSRDKRRLLTAITQPLVTFSVIFQKCLSYVWCFVYKFRCFISQL